MSKTRANLLLLLAAAFWGFGNVAQKTVLEHLDPLSAVGLRCLIAGLVVLPLVSSERHPNLGWRYWTSLARVSALFAVSIGIQQIAYQDTSVTNASFLVNTATVMTPLAAWLVIGERATAVIWLAAGATLIGALLMSGGLSASLSRGDLAALVSAACYALWMVELGRHMQVHGNPVAAAAAQFLGAAADSAAVGPAYWPSVADSSDRRGAGTSHPRRILDGGRLWHRDDLPALHLGQPCRCHRQRRECVRRGRCSHVSW